MSLLIDFSDIQTDETLHILWPMWNWQKRRLSLGSLSGSCCQSNSIGGNLQEVFDPRNLLAVTKRSVFCRCSYLLELTSEKSTVRSFKKLWIEVFWSGQCKNHCQVPWTNDFARLTFSYDCAGTLRILLCCPCQSKLDRSQNLKSEFGDDDAVNIVASR